MERIFCLNTKNLVYYIREIKLTTLGKHILSIDLPVTRNATLFPIVDTSLYESGLGISCERVEIYAPGFDCPPILSLTKGFKANLTACDLKMQTKNCDTENWLIPDGIYKIRYSVSPNDKVFVEYYHLRTVNTYNLYYDCLSNLDLCGEVIPQASFKKYEELRKIKLYLDNAKTKVEDFHELQEGLEMFQFVLRRLKKVCSTCNNC